VPSIVKEAKEPEILHPCRQCNQGTMSEVRRTELKPHLCVLELKCSNCGAVSWREQDERGWNKIGNRGAFTSSRRVARGHTRCAVGCCLRLFLTEYSFLQPI